MGRLSRCLILGSCLLALNGSYLSAAPNPLNPTVDGALTQMSITSAQLFQDLWQKQMGNGRCISFTNCGQNCSEKASLTSDGKSTCEKQLGEGCFSESNCKNVPNAFEVWTDAFGHWGRQDSREGYKHYQAKVLGGMVGLQAPISQILSIGGAVGYANTQIELSNDRSIQSWDGTLNLSLNPTNFYLDAALSFNWNQYKDERHIVSTGIDSTAHANYDGQQYTGLISGGYRLYTSYCLTITPTASLQYSYLHVDDYDERDAGIFDLQVESQGYNFLESGLGIKLSGPFQSDWGVFIPEIHGLWFYDYFGDEMDITSTLLGVTSQTKGPSRDRNWGDIGIGLTYYTCIGTSFEVVFNHEFSSTYHANEGLVKIAQRF